MHSTHPFAFSFRYCRYIAAIGAERRVECQRRYETDAPRSRNLTQDVQANRPVGPPSIHHDAIASCADLI
jgi:hypothetical protein